MLSELTEWVTDVIETLGYLGVALLVVLENLFPPIPSEVVLPFAGFVARDGDASLAGMVVAATVGSVVGSAILYGLTAAVGAERIYRLIARYGGWLRISEADIARTELYFDRHATKAVLLGRCVPLVRSLVSVPAGLRRMRFSTFLAYTTVGSAVWNAVLIGAGYVLRDRWHEVEPVLGYVQYAVVAGFALLVARFLVTRRHRPRL